MKHIKLLPKSLLTIISIISLTVMSFLPVLDVPIASADECTSISTGNNAYQSTLVGTKLYTNNRDSDTVSIIDTTTNTLLGSISISGPLFSTLVGTKLYVNSYTTNSVNVIDTTTDTLEPIGSTTGDYPAFSIASGLILYVINRDSDTVSVINTEGANPVLITTLPVGHLPLNATFVGTKLYVINNTSYTIIDTETNTVVETVTVGSNNLSATLVGTDLYINSYNAGVIVVNTGTNLVTDTISVSNPVYSIRDGDNLYVAGYGYIYIIDITTNTQVESIPLTMSSPNMLVLSGDNLYVSNNSGDYITVIDTLTNTPTDILTGTNPSFLTLAGTNIYTLNANSANVSVLDINTNTVIPVPCQTVPAVVNHPATLITKISATINGEITDTGGTVITARYFITLKAVDFNGGNPEYGNLIFSSPEYGSFGVGQFSADISGLVCGTDYFYLSSAENSAGQGIAFDPIGEFTTLPCVDDNPTPPVYIPSSSGYSPLLAWSPAVSTSPTPSLGTPGACPANLIITQNLKAPSRNGVYNSYTKGIVTEAKILQAHLNRLGFKSGKEDGILGPISTGAIKRMQTFLKTTPDGYVGPITRGLLNNSCGVNGLQN